MEPAQQGSRTLIALEGSPEVRGLCRGTVSGASSQIKSHGPIGLGVNMELMVLKINRKR